MAKKETSFVSIEILKDSTQELLGRQSVRTTFKLSEKSIDALSILAGQLGIKQKSLFDHLIDDGSVLRHIAKASDQAEIPRQRVAKTYVISRKTLNNLEEVSSQYQTPRDALVELSIERILPLITREKKKHEQRKKVLEKMSTLFDEAEEVFDMATQRLESEDPVYDRVWQMMKAINSCREEVESCVERGRKIEKF
ncbi:MAG: hypothetical protein ABR512_07280 [Desulfopila sp.]